MKENSTIAAITELLFLETEIEKVDLTIVFGNDWENTMNEVYKIYKKDLTGKILITGHSAKSDKEPEAKRFYKRAISLGIKKEDIILELEATNTKENIINSKKIIEEIFGFDNINKILFVCKTFHTRRVLMTAQRFCHPIFNTILCQ